MAIPLKIDIIDNDNTYDDLEDEDFVFEEIPSLIDIVEEDFEEIKIDYIDLIENIVKGDIDFYDVNQDPLLYNNSFKEYFINFANFYLNTDEILF